MNITFTAKETKNDELDIKKSNFTFCYLISIKNSNPNLWNTLKTIINNIDDENSVFNKSLSKKEVKK